ncbi:MAG: bifunctional oligoribonuclease/PAP phosphatase NrnA [Lachnospiraceae bacterium]
MKLEEALRDAKTVAISGHMRPDGDCVGSCMGLYQYIKQNICNIEVDVYLEEIPVKFNFIESTKEIKHEITEEKSYDLFISLDCGDIERLGFSKILYEKAKKTFCIDHHISNESFAMYNYIVPEASSTSELVYQLINTDIITKEVAMCLYLGIVHDTGVFQYTSTTPSTMEAAANLMRTGIDAAQIIDNTYYEKTFPQNKVLGYALLESKLVLNDKCITSIITQKDMEFFGVRSSDLDGIVSQLHFTQGVEVSVFLYELRPEEYKVSLRAKDKIDVSIIAQHFQGGGHKKAAGFTIFGDVQAAMQNILHEIAIQLR